MKLRYILLLLLLLGVAFVGQQYALYLKQLETLAPHREESVRYARLIESSMYEEQEIRQQLQQAEQRYQQLRPRLPEELGVKTFEQQLWDIAKKQQLKVLSTRSAIQSRPFYHEAKVNITLEGSDSRVKRFIKGVESLPRILKLERRKRPGNKLHHFTVSIYAAASEIAKKIELPSCIEKPEGLLLPLLTERLAAYYAEYTRHCNYVANYNELYLELLRLRALQQELPRLEAIAAELEASN